MTQTQSEQSMKDGSSTFLIVFGLGWTVFSLIFVMIGILIIRGESYLYNQLIDDGKVTDAMVTKLSVENSDESTGYYVTYEYKAPVNGDPTSFTSKEWVPVAFYNSLHIEQRLEVIYVASDPTIVRLKSQLTQPNAIAGWFFCRVGGIVFGGGIGDWDLWVDSAF